MLKILGDYILFGRKIFGKSNFCLLLIKKT